MHKQNRKTRLRLVIYTVLVGDKEALNNPLQLLGAQASSDVDISWVCFTDNAQLQSPVWQMRPFSEPLIPAEKMSRLPKAQPALFFAEFDYSLYIDNTVVLKRLPQRADIEGALFRGFRHPWRSSPLDEADIVVKSGLDKADVVAQQVDFYRQRGRALEQVGCLTAGTVLLRRHGDARVRRFGELWWTQILLFSKRDQLSLDLCAREAGCPVDYFVGDKTSNDLFLWPVLPDGRRVQGSFDDQKYAWEHRGDPVARAQPRQHFLQHGGDGERYGRRVPWFDYACERAGSSLGGQVPPRRGLAEVAGLLLKQPEVAAGPILVIGVQSAAAWSVEVEELPAAAAAINQYFRFAQAPQVLTAVTGVADWFDSAPFQGANGISRFAAVMVLGLQADCAARVLPKLRPLFGNHGQVLLEFGQSLDLPLQQQLLTSAPAGAQLQGFHGQHISQEGPVPSSVFLVTF